MEDNAKVSSAGSWITLVLTVTGASLAVRFTHLYFIGLSDWWNAPLGDARAYMDWAARIAGGDWVGSEGYYQAPLYPYLLAVIHVAFGSGVWPVVICQCLAGTMTAILVALTARSFWGHRVGLVAGILMATYGPGVYFDGIIQKTSFAGLATSIVLMTAAIQANHVRKRRCFGLGLSLAALCVLREHAFVWLPLFLFWCSRYGRLDRTMACWQSATMYSLGLLCVLMPIGVRNVAVTGSWSLSTFQAGPNFYIGNRAGADGRYAPLVRGHETPEFESRDATELAERALGRRLTPRQVSSYWMTRTLQDIVGDPATWAKLMVAKLAMVWNRYEIPDVESQYVVDDSSPTLRVLGRVWHFGVLCPLALAGVLAVRRDWRRLGIYYAMILAFAGAVALTFVSARYRYPLVPLLMPFAAVGAVYLYDRAKRRDLRVLGTRLVLVAGVAIATNVSVQDEDRLTVMSYMNLGVAIAQTGNLPGATALFRQAADRQPTSAEANNNLAQALALQGKYDLAIPRYRVALQIAPSLPGVHYNLAVALERTGRLTEALSHYRMALAQSPRDVDARVAADRLSNPSP